MPTIGELIDRGLADPYARLGSQATIKQAGYLPVTGTLIRGVEPASGSAGLGFRGADGSAQTDVVSARLAEFTRMEVGSSLVFVEDPLAVEWEVVEVSLVNHRLEWLLTINKK